MSRPCEDCGEPSVIGRDRCAHHVDPTSEKERAPKPPRVRISKLREERPLTFNDFERWQARRGRP